MTPGREPTAAGRSVLVLAGDPGLANALRNELERSGFRATVAPRVEEALQHWDDRCYEAMVVDLALPDGAGYRFVAELRRAGHDTPVLLLTAPYALEDLLTVQRGWPGWQAAVREGLDDVPTVLHALLRHERTDSARRLRHAGLELDRFERRACIGGREVALTPAEFGILQQLLLHAEHLVTREALTGTVWGPEREPESNALDVHLGHIRRKLRDHDHVVGIDTVRGRGYILKRRTEASAA